MTEPLPDISCREQDDATVPDRVGAVEKASTRFYALFIPFETNDKAWQLA